MREEKVSFSNSRGDILAGRLHHPVNGRLAGGAILCHGMDSNKESDKLVLIARELARRGILTLRFDFSYVGESSGKFEEITYAGEVDDLKAAYALIQDRRPGKTAILGSSMGGTVALLFAAQEPAVSALVTIAAPVHPEQFPKRILTPKQLQQWRDRQFIIYNEQRLNVSLLDDLETVNVPEAAKNIACPVLILHGDADDVVPVEEAHELHRSLAAPTKLSILTGADHRLSDAVLRNVAVGEAVEWICRHLREG